MSEEPPTPETVSYGVPETVSSCAGCAGAFFHNAQRLVVSGGTFTNNVSLPSPTVPPTIPSDYRIIPLGDVDLLNEIRLADTSGVVTRRRSGRKLYTVRLDGRPAKMTAAVYQGGNGEEDWRHELQMYSGVRHPNIVQIYGAVSSGGLYATIFYDEFMPLAQFYSLYKDSPIASLYVEYGRCLELQEVKIYMYTLSRTLMTPGSEQGNLVGFRPRESIPDISAPPPDANCDSVIVFALSLQQYHHITWCHYGRWYRTIIQTSGTIQMGSLVHVPHVHLTELVELAWMSGRNLHDEGWQCEKNVGILLQNGWTRFKSDHIADRSIERTISFGSQDSIYSWFSQANYIFRCLQVRTNYEEYGLVDQIHYEFHLGESLPAGYLFLCPLEDLELHGSGRFKLSQHQAFWSLHSSGTPELSAAEATELGFPPPLLEMHVDVRLWEEGRVYTALRQFHKAKGFDPEGQGIARHLGYPMYRLAQPAVIPFELEAPTQSLPQKEDRSREPQVGHILVTTAWRWILATAIMFAALGVALASFILRSTS
ncbi:hypothetical protein B0H11DRAFT_2298404 [Mycena galericulata]|nr:hypothetical protein B0H11DRAFT_2298404 [Mycena galericulata]